MGRPYTSGAWTAKAGREDEFVTRWRALAQWASEEFPDAGRPILLRDMNDTRRFTSLGSWRDVDQIAAFRAHPEFSRHVARLSEVLDGFVPSTLEAVVEP